MPSDVTMAEIEATGVKTLNSKASSTKGQQPGSKKDNNTSRQYTSIVRKWWNGFVSYAQWDPEKAREWIDKDKKVVCCDDSAVAVAVAVLWLCDG